jgi:hypothetical protein
VWVDQTASAAELGVEYFPLFDVTEFFRKDLDVILLSVSILAFEEVRGHLVMMMMMMMMRMMVVVVVVVVVMMMMMMMAVVCGSAHHSPPVVSDGCGHIGHIAMTKVTRNDDGAPPFPCVRCCGACPRRC